MHPPPPRMMFNYPPIVIIIMIIILLLVLKPLFLASALIFFLKYIFNQWEVFLLSFFLENKTESPLDYVVGFIPVF